MLPRMKRFLPLVSLVLALSLLAVPLALAATTPAVATDRSPAAPIAGTISTITGIAISPLLGTGVYGAYKWFNARDQAARDALPWFAQVKFWLPALLIVGICAAKDAFGAVLPPGWKKPLDVLETVENQASGLVAAGAVIPVTMLSLSEMLAGSDASAAPVLAPSGLAMLSVGAIDGASLLSVLTVPFAIALFAVVWLASHAINVLILLSPWGAIDAALKSARLAVLGLLTVSATMNPWLGALLSVAVIVVAYFVAGWSFRLTVFGSVFSWDFLTRRRRRFRPEAQGNRMFACGDLPEVPVRTYGRLAVNSAGGLEFIYRPWLVLPARTAVVPTASHDLAVGRGLFVSSLTRADGETLFLLPPRYRGHEETIATLYRAKHGVRATGLRKAWNAMGEMIRGCATRPQLA